MEDETPLLKDNRVEDWSFKMNWIIIKLVYDRNAYMSYADYEILENSGFEVYEFINPITQKFRDIASFLWDHSQPNYLQEYFKDHKPLSGKELRDHFIALREDMAVISFGLPPMVTLPLGAGGQNVSVTQLHRAVKYCAAMKVDEGDEETIVVYKSIEHEKADAKMIFMYVNELQFKFRMKQKLKDARRGFEDDDYSSYRRYVKMYHRTMDYQDKRDMVRAQTEAKFLQDVIQDWRSYTKDN